MSKSTDRIEKTIVLHAPLARVWRAISESDQFGRWFGMRFDGPFVAGKQIIGRIAPTEVDPEIAKMQEPHAGLACALHVEQIEPMRLLSFRWHPFAIDSNIDYSKEPTTLVSFELKEQADGILLTIVESGFDQIPLERRAKAFAANEGGWSKQLELISTYIAKLQPL